MTPLKLYREWFEALKPNWQYEISRQILKDALLAAPVFLYSAGTDDEENESFEAMQEFPQYLINVIESRIELGILDYERVLCQQLFISTSYVLANLSLGVDNLHKVLSEIQMQNLFVKPDFYEESIKRTTQIHVEALELKLEWEKFTVQYFNIEHFITRENG